MGAHGVVTDRHLPVRPDLARLEREAEQLLDAARSGDAGAIAELAAVHDAQLEPESATIEQARLALARSYQAPSWERLRPGCELVDAIWRDDPATVRALVTAHPEMIRESALVRPSNWGPPLSYAANLGRDRIIRLLYDLGARDLESALQRAALQSRIETAGMLYDLMGRTADPDGALGGPAYTLSDEGTALDARLRRAREGRTGAPPRAGGLVLETDSRKPAAKHAHSCRCTWRTVSSSPTPPDGAPSRSDRSAPGSSSSANPACCGGSSRTRRSIRPSWAATTRLLATHGTPLAGSTLLHMCVDYGELEIARWLLDRGMDVDAPAAVNADGFGGHTALFATVVSQTNFWMNYGRAGRRRRRSPGSCSTTAPTPTRAPRFASSSIPATGRRRTSRTSIAT